MLRKARLITVVVLSVASIAIIATVVIISGMVFRSSAAVQPGADGNTRCDCSHLKALQAELFNALLLQQAFRNKIPELRTMNAGTSKGALKQFAEGEARRGLKDVPDYKGPDAFDYTSWGDVHTDPDHLPANKTDADLCAFSEDAGKLFNRAKQASACAGIAAALEAHEQVHISTCNRLHYRPYLTMHGADRAQEEVEAYGAQIKVLREILAGLRCGYRATGKTADTTYSGVICSLDEPFTVIGSNAAMTYPFKFIPSSTTGGTVSFQATTSLPISASGSGRYTIEGAATEAPHIMMTLGSTGVTPVGSRSGGGTVRIDLVPLESGECGSK